MFALHYFSGSLKLHSASEEGNNKKEEDKPVDPTK